jgi:hypothetical protein
VRQVRNEEEEEASRTGEEEGRPMRRLSAIALVGLCAVGVLAMSGSAAAAPSDAFVYKSTFGESFGFVDDLSVNYQSGSVLISAGGSVHQVDSSGDPVNFPAVGSPEVPGGGIIQVDNSPGANQNNFYVFEGSNYRSYKADGTPLGIGVNGPGWYAPITEELGIEPCGGGVAPNGNLWIVGNRGKVVEVTPEGEPTGTTVQLDISPTTETGLPCQLVADGAGNAYLKWNFHDIFKYDLTAGFARLGKIESDEDRSFHGIAVDPSTHAFYYGQDRAGAPSGEGVKGDVLTRPAAPPAPGAATTVLDAEHGVLVVFDLAFDGSGQTMYLDEANKIRIFHREPPSPPSDLAPLKVKEVRSGGAVIESGLIARGAPVTYRFEFGPDTTYSDGVSAPVEPEFKYYPISTVGVVSGLKPGRKYHIRMAATNSAGTSYGPDRTLTTYPATPGGGVDPCPNALARKQTGAQAVPDCRAYELVSAANTGGYDVESYLAPEQSPFPGFPFANDRLLYATHAGAVPGPWNATNHGPDPYLATRTDSGWVTDYLGLPSDINPAAGSFSSVLGEADSSLSTLAFAGPNLCSPCFTEGGLETGIPLRLADGSLIQGMSGSLAAGVPASARPEGTVARYFSEDGDHLVFASKYAFEPGANTGGDLTVYDRNLNSGTTQIVSRDQNGAVLAGTVSELDISTDGSRIVTATELDQDSEGNAYVHPYMHIGSSANGVDLAPGTSTGVLYAGMTADGSRVFFTTPDALLGEDTDTSADLYEAAVGPSGHLDLNVVTAPDSDACNPVSNSAGEHWNTTGSTANCDAVSISGGGGVAEASGAIYFLSPELLDGGEGTVNQPNLYRASPGGAAKFVATLEPDNSLVLDSVKANAVRRTGDFQVTPGGDYAAFISELDLSGQDTFGFRTAFRYDSAADEVACLSCDLSESGEQGIAGDSELAPDGLSLLGDGRVFFTSAAQLVNNDPNRRRDVYVWSSDGPALISSGIGAFDSGLLTASADGNDIFFFTHDALAPEEDHNGRLIKIYDARVNGGFFKLPDSVPCQASDECHGPGSVAAPAPDIRSSGKTTAGNVLTCPKNRVKKHGRCVKKPKKNKKKSSSRKRGGRNA